ncbi:MAG: hypothetical protein KKA73_00925 [Chloroflexi bacterium]|nr:hypothetical protein [Chloroflexota bacterium]MBU1746226.1 hypothetical protein [Chloroflexota bacterium]MBU1879924.1 hypothetical protein [Chloroflexota bacterium]
MYLASQTRVAPSTTIQVERLLPVRGEVLVQMGQRVEPAEDVAQTSLPGQSHMVDVARHLGVGKDQIQKFMLKKEGDVLQPDEVIAARRRRLGLGQQRFSRTPVAGTLVDLSTVTGRVTIVSQPTPFSLKAHVKGRVVNVMPRFGVVIEAQGALIWGCTGRGGEASGVLRMVVENPTDELVAGRIDISCHGSIIVGGAWISEAALLQAARMNVRGIVVGGMDATRLEHSQDLHTERNQNLVVVILEGFGHIPMAQETFDLLASLEGREASIRGEPDHAEVIVPRMQAGETVAPPAHTFLEPGSTVRVVREPYMSQIGTVLAVPSRARIIETGVLVRGVEVELSGGERVFVPRTNVELVLH